ncbi:MAG: hypothetical protein ACTSYB_14655 [Candidatus Helarchaeota archaeon]
MENHKILGICSVSLFIINFSYYCFSVNLPDAFNLCYFTLIILGIGLITDNRLIYSIGAFYTIFPIVQIIFRVIGLLSYEPHPVSFWLIFEMFVHTSIILVAVIGYQRFHYFRSHTWLIALALALLIWFLTFVFNSTEINVNYTLSPPVFLTFLDLWEFLIFISIALGGIWLLLNHFFSIPQEIVVKKNENSY